MRKKIDLESEELQHVQVVLPPALAVLLQRYTDSINHQRGLKKQRVVGAGRVAGAILTRFLLAHEKEIHDGFSQAVVHKLRHQLRRLGGPEDPDAR